MKRVIYLDLCRGFTVLFIPIIHCVMLYSKTEVHHSWLGSILSFIAEYPGGQMFMLMMGMWVAKTNKPFTSHLKKAGMLFILGYILNFLKYGITGYLGWLPVNFVAYLGFEDDRLILDILTIGDILQFSSISLIIAAVIKEFKGSRLIAFVLLVLVVCFSSFFWDMHSDSIIVQHILNLIGGHPNHVFFPVFPWIAFVLTGFVIAMGMEESVQWMITMFLIGAALFYVGLANNTFANPYGFYRTDAAGSLQEIGFLLMWIPFWKWITPIVSHFECLIVTFTFCSRNITAIYFIQWVVIAWMFPVIGFRVLGVWESLAVGSVATVVVMMLTYLFSTFFLDKKS